MKDLKMKGAKIYLSTLELKVTIDATIAVFAGHVRFAATVTSVTVANRQECFFVDVCSGWVTLAGLAFRWISRLFDG